MKVLDSYTIESEGIGINVDITKEEEAFVRRYRLAFPEFGAGTQALLNRLKAEVISDIKIQAERMLDVEFIQSLKEKFSAKARALLQKEAPKMPKKTKETLIVVLLHEMLGLGKLEFLLNDANLEEIVINNSKDPLWVYHKKFGWLETNIFVLKEEETQNYASIIARRVGKQITTLAPLLDAHLITGDRANATLFPISGMGNTLTIRRFRRRPWTVTDVVDNKTASLDVMALLWLATEYELNILISGGTASGKTSFMNVLMPFIQPNHRVLTIEDTRELSLPESLHWVPLTTRQPNPEGKGGVSMLDLLVNSLRMRPDRIIVGEIRRQREAEVLFEAMHTGHSVCTTVHANTATETVRRLTSPPIMVPIPMLEAVHLNVVMFRNRRLGIRRILQVAELIMGKEKVEANILYRWRGSNDSIVKHATSIRLFDEISLHTGMLKDEITKELAEKRDILTWMQKQDIRSIQDVGKLMAEYYFDPESILKLMRKNKKPVLE
jgi:flagellar protein FlaI